jgi:hypothetical protein
VNPQPEGANEKNGTLSCKVPPILSVKWPIPDGGSTPSGRRPTGLKVGLAVHSSIYRYLLPHCIYWT